MEKSDSDPKIVHAVHCQSAIELSYTKFNTDQDLRVVLSTFDSTFVLDFAYEKTLLKYTP